jgi:hypothetical protein
VEEFRDDSCQKAYDEGPQNAHRVLQSIVRQARIDDFGSACITIYVCARSAPRSDWKEYLVPDFGTRVEYPAGIFSVSEGKSEVGVGERLSTADKRASLTIYALPNQAGETPGRYVWVRKSSRPQRPPLAGRIS